MWCCLQYTPFSPLPSLWILIPSSSKTFAMKSDHPSTLGFMAPALLGSIYYTNVLVCHSMANLARAKWIMGNGALAASSAFQNLSHYKGFCCPISSFIRDLPCLLRRHSSTVSILSRIRKKLGSNISKLAVECCNDNPEKFLINQEIEQKTSL